MAQPFQCFWHRAGFAAQTHGRQPLIRSTYIAIRRLLVLVIGVSVLIVGVIMIVTPGPAIIVIPAGLALLATEFLWARRVLERVQETVKKHTTGKTPGAPADVEEKG